MTDNDTTGLDRLLRTVADSLPDNPALAEQVAGRGRRHRARTRAAVVVTGVAVVAAAAVALVAVNVSGSPHPGGVNRITINSTPTNPRPAPTPSGQASPLTTRQTFGRLSYTLPRGWKVLYDTNHGPENFAGATLAAGESACLVPQRAKDVGTCAGIQLDRGGFAGWESTQFVAHQPGGWYAGTGVSPCPVNPTHGVGGFNGMQVGPVGRGPTDMAPTEQGTRHVGTLTYDYDKWLGHCDDGFAFTPQAWSLPVSGYRILDLLSHPETVAFLRSITLR